MTFPDSWLLDTNLLIYASIAQFPDHLLARRRLKEFEARGAQLWISPQVIRELIAVLTRPNYFNPPIARQTALSIAEAYSQHYQMLPETREVLDQLLALLRTVPHQGRKIHEVKLAATAVQHGIGGILTVNGRDFAAFDNLLRIESLI